MEDGKPIVPQIHECETLVYEVLAEGMKMDEYLQVGVLLKKLSPSWKDYHDQLKHKRKDFTLKELTRHQN